MIEVNLGQLVKAMAEAPAGVEIEAHHHRVVDRRDIDAELVEHHPVIFEVVADLEHRRSSSSGFSFAEHQLHRQLVGRVGIKVGAAVPDAGCSRPGSERWRG